MEVSYWDPACDQIMKTFLTPTLAVPMPFVTMEVLLEMGSTMVAPPSARRARPSTGAMLTRCWTTIHLFTLQMVEPRV